MSKLFFHATESNFSSKKTPCRIISKWVPNVNLQWRRESKLSLGDFFVQTWFNVGCNWANSLFSPLNFWYCGSITSFYSCRVLPYLQPEHSGDHSDWSYSGAISCLSICEKWGLCWLQSEKSFHLIHRSVVLPKKKKEPICCTVGSFSSPKTQRWLIDMA